MLEKKGKIFFSFQKKIQIFFKKKAEKDNVSPSIFISHLKAKELTHFGSSISDSCPSCSIRFTIFPQAKASVWEKLAIEFELETECPITLCNSLKFAKTCSEEKK